MEEILKECEVCGVELHEEDLWHYDQCLLCDDCFDKAYCDCWWMSSL